MKKILLALMFIGVGCSTTPPTKTDTSQEDNPACKRREQLPRATNRDRRIYFSYCFYRLNQKADSNLIYFNHGKGNSHEALHKKIFIDTSFINFQKLILQLGPDSPNIISISFGQTWLLTSSDDKKLFPREATISIYQRIMGYLEAKHNLVPPKRYSMGISMGGLNTLQLIMHTPVGTFDQAVVINPAIPRCYPWNLLDLKCLTAPIIRSQWTKDQWASQNPTGIVGSSKFSSLTPPVQLQRSLKDKLVHPETSKALLDVLLSRGVVVDHVTNSRAGTVFSGGHGEFVVEKVVEFLSEKEKKVK